MINLADSTVEPTGQQLQRLLSEVATEVETRAATAHRQLELRMEQEIARVVAEALTASGIARHRIAV